MEKIIQTLNHIPNNYFWISGMVILIFVLLAIISARSAKKEEERERYRNHEYWTYKRLSDYRKAKKESEEQGIPY